MTKEEAVDKAIELEFGSGNAKSIRAHNSSLVKVAEHLYDLMQLSLPPNLDEAASSWTHNHPYSYPTEIFKAGAEWMAMQGETKRGVATQDHFIQFADDTYIDLDPTMKLIPAFKIKDAEEIFVQIRKKQ